MADNNWIWVLNGEPKDIRITDKDGNERKPDLEKIKKYTRLKPALVAGGRYGKGVGVLFYGGKPLGNKKELTDKGNKYTTNTEILRAIGFEHGEQKEPQEKQEDKD